MIAGNKPVDAWTDMHMDATDLINLQPGGGNERCKDPDRSTRSLPSLRYGP